MVFLCGRPACGRESSATLQIDAPAMTISLVDPRVSRDGIPLCPHHADATTPPMGWTMNDLRSENRAPLAPVRSIAPATGEVANNSRPRFEPGPGENQLFRRTSSGSGSDDSRDDDEQDDDGDEVETATAEAEPLRFQVSRDMNSMPITAAQSDAARNDRQSDDRRAASGQRSGDESERRGEADDSASRRDAAQSEAAPADGGSRVRRNPPPNPPVAPASRPAKRREEADDGDETEDDKFPWHHHFEDDEPAELQAKSPLLSRAFRSSVG